MICPSRLIFTFILNRIEEDLRAKGVLTGERPDPTAFATMMVGHYIRFPQDCKRRLSN